jgi:hypothetical protein
MTFQRTVLNIIKRDFALSLNYVVVSRIKALDSLLFEETFNYKRFHKRTAETIKIRVADVKRRYK